MHLTSVDTDVPQLEHPRTLRQQQYLHKQLLDLLQKSLAKVCYRIMVRMQAPGYEPKWNTLVGGLLDLARAKYPRGVAIEQQTQQDLRRNQCPSLIGILLVEFAHVKLGNDIHHKARQVAGRQYFCQPNDLVQTLFVIRIYNFSHTQSLS